ncbi:amidase signature domain-containing protein [Naematelia encephala]|uniref:Amidase signature domain-containing protein n=1 Tax=Naematelia encephala TaxID=71784 RepID=A0A1Y2BAU6_9TREE|nr:amidase signature domain-containing protein [Naematelia encephala]
MTVEYDTTGKIDVVRSTMEELVAAMKRGETTSEALVLEYLSRIEANDKQGLELQAILEIAPREKLLKAARKLDEERRNGRTRSKLHGLALLLKDCIATGPELGMETTAGTNALLGCKPAVNAELVENLLKAGILVIGKSNMTVLNGALGAGLRSGWSPRGGQTKTAYGKFDPGGSSTGSAVGTSEGFCSAGIGAETDGSLVSPSRVAALYGLKPTVGLVSVKGVIGITPKQDSLGPICKSPWDVAALLSILVTTPHDYTQYTSAPHVDLSSYRLGIPRINFEADKHGSDVDTFPDVPALEADARKLFDLALDKLRAAAAAVVDPADIPGAGDLGKVQDDSQGEWVGKRDLPFCVDAYEQYQAYFRDLRGGSITTLEDLIEWHDAHPEQSFIDPSNPARQSFLEHTAYTKGKPVKGYEESLAKLQVITDNVLATLDKDDLDALVFPSGFGGAGTWAAHMAAPGGLPIATVPIGLLSNGEPFGLYIIARRHDEGKLLSIMSACERLFPARAVPPNSR